MPAAVSSLSSTARFALLPITPRNGKLAALAENLFEDRAVGRVAHRHANDKRVVRKFGHERAVARRIADFSQPAARSGMRSSHSARGSMHVTWQSSRPRQSTTSLATWPAPKTTIRQSLWLYVSKKSFTVPPQVMPTSRLRFHSSRAVASAVGCRLSGWASNCLGVLNGFVLHAAAADRARDEAVGRDEHFAAGVLRRAA